MNKKKIFNDPVYGFITFQNDLVYEIIDHPYFQRLRRINQLGLTDYVYPGALHSRLHHAIGATFLMSEALNNLRLKGVEITEAEYEAALVAILLHDIGHGPFSHVLEHSILDNVHHESISLLIMEKLNKEFSGALDLAISVFKGTYKKKFLHQLVSSQLDIDRLDYLNRDCYFTGVTEGVVGVERLIKMLQVHEGNIVVEEKGVYSVENFLNARRLMYWQVYLHKTALSAEIMLMQLINRAKFLAQKGHKLISTDALTYFIENNIGKNEFVKNNETLDRFTQLDDYDIWGAIKFWNDSDDFALKFLSNGLLNRNLFRIKLDNKRIDKTDLKERKKTLLKHRHINEENLPFLMINDKISNMAYISQEKSINVLLKSGKVIDVAEASDLPNIKAIRKIVRKYYLCYPKDIYLW